jgi:hypothetical protein
MVGSARWQCKSVDCGIRCDGEVGNGGFLLVEGNTDSLRKAMCELEDKVESKRGISFPPLVVRFFSWFGEGSYSLHKSRSK